MARRVLATALGLDEATLAGVDADSLQTALDRIRSLVAHSDHLAAEAMTDELTGAQRRGSGISALQRELDRARRTRNDGIVVV